MYTKSTLSIVSLLMTGCSAQVGEDISTSQNALTVLGMAEYKAPTKKQIQNATNSPMLPHGGITMPGATIYPIFWGTSWADTKFDGTPMPAGETDEEIRTNMNLQYSDMMVIQSLGASHYLDALQVNGGINPVMGNYTYIYDGSFAKMAKNDWSPQQIVDEVCIATANNPDPNGIYMVFPDTTRATRDYCAWHSWGKCKTGAHTSVPVLVVDIPIDWDDTDCDPGDTAAFHAQMYPDTSCSGGDPNACYDAAGNFLSLGGTMWGVPSGQMHTVPEATHANAIATMIAETLYNPTNDGWWDADKNENGDKCAWSFSQPVEIPNGGGIWKFQELWQNGLYPNGQPNMLGLRGCAQGQ